MLCFCTKHDFCTLFWNRERYKALNLKNSNDNNNKERKKEREKQKNNRKIQIKMMSLGIICIEQYRKGLWNE